VQAQVQTMLTATLSLGAGVHVTVVKAAIGVLPVSDEAHGSVYTLEFWGMAASASGVPLMTAATGCGGAVYTAADSVVVNTGRSAVAYFPSTPRYSALAAGQSWSVRVAAKNAKGYGAPSAALVVPAPAFAVLPPVPVSVSMFDEGTGNSLGLFYLPAPSDGGTPINKYRVEVSRNRGTPYIPRPFASSQPPAAFLLWICF
jgi:hypothetical protein